MFALMLTIALACSPQEDFKISCRNYCYMSWQVKTYQVVNGKCHCSIPEDIDAKLNLVPNLVQPRRTYGRD